MGMQAIEKQFSLGIGKDQSVLSPLGNRTLFSFPIPREKYFDILLMTDIHIIFYWDSTS
jgi:hypothetical protein